MAGNDAGSFTYDGNLKRVKQTIDGRTIYSIYDRSGAILTRDDATGSEKTDFVTVGGQTFVRISNGTPSYPLNDHLGSAYMVADQIGAVTAANTYNLTPFGEGIGNDAGTQNKQGYTGHIEDETGLTYMQARYYDPVIGRFLSADPIGYADQLNLYAYVGNDPLNKMDPLGLEGFVPRHLEGHDMTPEEYEHFKETAKDVGSLWLGVLGGASAVEGLAALGNVAVNTMKNELPAAAIQLLKLFSNSEAVAAERTLAQEVLEGTSETAAEVLETDAAAADAGEELAAQREAEATKRAAEAERAAAESARRAAAERVRQMAKRAQEEAKRIFREQRL